MKRNHFNWCTMLLILSNIVTFGWQVLLFPDPFSANQLVQEGAMLGTLHPIHWSRFFTNFFLHIGVQHLLSNMLSLYFMGQIVENTLGKVRFLIIYMISGLSGSIAVYLLQPTAVTAGASSAIFGLMGALLVLVFMNRDLARMLGSWVFMTIAYNLYYTFVDHHISTFGHLGGFIGGIVITLLVSVTITKNQPVTYKIDKNRTWS